jgi:hypothetical protein
MAKIFVNPLKWFKNKNGTPKPAVQRSIGSAKRPAHPKKSGNIFMHLITLQKNLQSTELSLRQENDCRWLIQKSRAIVSSLKVEAEKVEEDDLAQGAGQILAYLDTTLEGRLDVDEEGITTVLDFVLIFKDALGDAIPGIRALDNGQLEEWNTRYQALMARMKPIEEKIVLPDSQDEPEESLPEPVAEILLEPSVPGNGFAEVEPEEQQTPTTGEFIVSQADAEELRGSNGSTPADESEAEELKEEAPLVNADDLNVRDVAIPDAEIKSARELLESKASFEIPAPLLPKESGREAEVQKVERIVPKNGHNGENHVKNPVQLQEVERLKKRLLELHEKQGMLSTRMSGILGDLKKAVDSEEKEKEVVSVEKLNIDEIEDLIFIGRKKG